MKMLINPFGISTARWIGTIRWGHGHVILNGCYTRGWYVCSTVGIFPPRECFVNLNPVMSFINNLLDELRSSRKYFSTIINKFHCMICVHQFFIYCNYSDQQAEPWSRLYLYQCQSFQQRQYNLKRNMPLQFLTWQLNQTCWSLKDTVVVGTSSSPPSTTSIFALLFPMFTYQYSI